MEVEERLKRARIQIQKKNSFFAYLSLYLKFSKVEEDELPDKFLAGINERGNFYYNEEKMGELTDLEIEGVVIHEILHLSFLHLLRVGARDREGWNICADIVVNQIIKDNNFKLPDGCLLSNHDNEIDIGGYVVKDCDKKTAEEIYAELEKEFSKKKYDKYKKGKCGKGQKGKGKKYGVGNKGRFDAHLEGDSGKDGKDGKKLSDGERRELEKEWNDRTREALTISKMRGDTPRGVGRLIGKLHEEKINWKALLNQYITQQLPYDYTWASASKKSKSVGVYMPSILKEKIDIVIGIDVSGSIGKEELTDFLSEIIGMARAYQDRITMRLITHECEVVDNWVIENGNIERIKELDIKGGGGTEHKSLFNYIKEKERDCKCAIFLTDGYSDIDEINFEEYAFDKLFVISKGGHDRQLKGKRCNTIKLEDLDY